MKKGLTLEEHKEYGKILKRMYADSMQLLTAFGNVYPKNKRVNKQLWKLYNTIVEVKSEADNELFSDHPTVNNTALNCYFGPEEFKP